jgi:hypothetical protein
MKKVYKVRKIILNNYDFKTPMDADIWESIPVLKIGCYPWDTTGYTPEVEVKLFYTEYHLHLLFKVWEEKTRATFINTNDDVYKDSCVEFFFKPDYQEDDKYFNFEMNPFGTLLIGLGKDRSTRKRLHDIDTSIFNIFTSINSENIKEYNKEFWFVEYSIPFSFIERYFKGISIGDNLKYSGNFYKCGDAMEHPHYGCWSLIHSSEPDFHKPEYFGTLILQRSSS